MFIKPNDTVLERRIENIICYGLPLPIIILSIFIGTSFNPFVAADDELMDMTKNIILNVRLPRIILTFMVGAALSVSGAVLQSLFRNPLIDSYILGISSGAAFGASLAIVYTLSFLNIYAFVGGSIAVLLTYFIAGKDRQNSTITIVLSGMIVSGIFTALLSFVQYVSNPYKLQAIIQWTMGNLHSASWNEVEQAIGPILISGTGIYFFRWRLNLLALGDDAARAVGVNPIPDKIFLIICATLMTTATVAVAGIISFYGLFVPHIVRMLVGADNKRAIPANIFLGGSFLILIDTLSRTLFTFEVPIGIFTTLLGGGFFIFLMKKNRLNWN